MKQIFNIAQIFLTSFLASTVTFSQSIGIGIATPDATAITEIKSSSKGLLMPRMTTAQRLAISTPAIGLIVFDLTTHSFWYRDNTGWIETTPSSNTWNLKGNAGTNPAINYIGTADNLPLHFRLSNHWAGELNYLTLNYSLGYDAAGKITSGIENVAVGDRALYPNITGSSNVAIGVAALSSNSSGSFNTAVGEVALLNCVSGGYNTSVGSSSLSSLNYNASYNTAIGYYAGTGTAAAISYATAIGAFSQVNCSHCMVLGGVTPYQTYVGINNISPTHSLDIKQFQNGISLRHLNDNYYGPEWGINHGANGNLLLVYNNAVVGSFDKSTGVYSSLSDKKVKTNINLLPDVMNKIMRLQPVCYNFNGDDNDAEKSMGFIAQQIKEIFPELAHNINTEKEDVPYDHVLTLDYNVINVIAIKALQEQENILDKQEMEINQLKKELQSLLSKNN